MKKGEKVCWDVWLVLIPVLGWVPNFMHGRTGAPSAAAVAGLLCRLAVQHPCIEASNNLNFRSLERAQCTCTMHSCCGRSFGQARVAQATYQFSLFPCFCAHTGVQGGAVIRRSAAVHPRLAMHALQFFSPHCHQLFVLRRFTRRSCCGRPRGQARAATAWLP